MRAFVPFVLALLAAAAHADPATERYAPAQLYVAQDLLQRARAAAERGNAERARLLAAQASFDARLAWGMTESEALRADAARVGGAASALISELPSP
jgi:hypothetical protein